MRLTQILPERLRVAASPYLKRFRKSPSHRILPAFRAGPAPTLAEATTQFCTTNQFREPHYEAVARKLGQDVIHHRKQWEHVFVVAAIEQCLKITPGMRGLTFGAGREPAPAYFASVGCEVVATDAPPDALTDVDWIATNQHATGVDALRFPEVCDEETFARNVTFRSVDMNNIPDDLRGFDFLWSSCALEHLGSLEHGLSFIKNAMKCLKPGGVAVHTTEFNVSDLQNTYETNTICFYRKSDIERLASECAMLGFELATPNWQSVCTPEDLDIDWRPYSDRHTKIVYGNPNIVGTSLGLIVRRT
jgi:2-polyprenyl-3-methyl-5-hydroxy-6-metoxy-1,4-benzoquinol methylase